MSGGVTPDASVTGVATACRVRAAARRFLVKRYAATGTRNPPLFVKRDLTGALETNKL
jgi:hypothetical protein